MVFLPNMVDPASPSGDTARPLSVPVVTSATVAISSAPVTVSEAARYILVALEIFLFVRVAVTAS